MLFTISWGEIKRKDISLPKNTHQTLIITIKNQSYILNIFFDLYLSYNWQKVSHKKKLVKLNKIK